MQANLPSPSSHTLPHSTAANTTIKTLIPLLHRHRSSSRRPATICSSSTETVPPPPQTVAAADPSRKKLNKYSSRITEPKSQGGSQAILYGVGLSDEDMGKPQIGISSVWYEGNTCNMHLLSLAEAVKEGVRLAGMVGFRFEFS
ncbi:dihydroxy-acid dehydratase [Sarracenia purpurea var. burkii]